MKKFTNALLKGLQDTYNDPKAAAAILKKYVPNTDVDVAAAELEIDEGVRQAGRLQGSPG